MKNEYGVKLDRNGYAPSIIPGHDEYRCLLCGKNGMGFGCICAGGAVTGARTVCIETVRLICN